MFNKLRCVVVDDDYSSIKLLNDMCRDSNIAEISHSYTSPRKFLEEQDTLTFDACLFDIVMPEMDGLSLSTKVNDKPVILITSALGKLVDAVDMAAPIDVLRKPIKQERLFRAFEKVRAYRTQLDKAREFKLFSIAGESRKICVKLSDIVWVRIKKENTDHKQMFLKSGQCLTITGCTFEELRNCCDFLIQTNKAELISKEAIGEVVNNQIVVLKNFGCAEIQKIYLSRSFKKSFFLQMT